MDDELTEQMALNKALVLRARAVLAGVVAVLVVVALVSSVAIGPAALLLVALVGGGAYWLWSYLGRADQRALALSGAVPAEGARHARLHNITDGLCSSTGIARPALWVIEEPAPNAFAVATDPRRPSIVVTSGVVDSLTPIEMEGLIAQQLAHIRALDTLPATLAVVFPPLRRRLPEFREWLADRGAIGITRYPPGLIGALEKVLAGLGGARSRPAAIEHLWTGPPAVSSPALDVRVDALREL